MSSESIVTALFLISAVVAAGVLINAVFPIISRTTETFGSVSHAADSQMRTDVKIVNTFAKNGQAQVWMKNTGTARIAAADLNGADIFTGEPGNFERVPAASRSWELLEGANGQWWDPGETLHITATSNLIPGSGEMAYFAFVLPNGVRRSAEFVAD